VIDPTDEMIAAAMEAFNSTGAYEPVVAAVLAIVERDYYVGERMPARCLATTGAFRCRLASGHDGMHNAADSWAEMSWP
jgi:hypothetical protein